MSHRQPPVEIDEELIATARAVSDRLGLPEAELYERALRDVLSRDFSMLMDEIAAGQRDRSFSAGDDDGMALAYRELRASRADRPSGLLVLLDTTDVRRDGLHEADPVVRAGATREPGDGCLIALALESGAELIVAGDRDFLDLAEPSVNA